MLQREPALRGAGEPRAGGRLLTLAGRAVLFALAIGVALWPVPSVPATGSPETGERVVEVRFDPRGELGADELAGVLRLSSGDEEGLLRELPVASSDRARIALPPGSRWRVCPDLDGWWSPCSVLTVVAGPGVLQHEVELWPAGRLAGRLRAPKEAGPLPAVLEASFQTPHTVGRTAAIARSRRQCPIAEDGGWECELPATALDVTLRVPGFVVERLWAVGIARGETHDTGLVTLRRGASVAAWVRFAEGDGRPDECSARLFPFVPAGRARPTEAQRAARTVAEASVLDNGFVQLGPVAAGTYALEVTHPDYAPAQVYPLELQRDDETLLRDPVELRRPLTVGIAIHPPTDWRGLPWQVLLARASDLTGSYAGGSAFEGGTDAEGRVVVADQTPGAFVLKVLDSTGDPFYARMDLVIDSADDARVEVDIDLVVLTGEVTLDDEPVQATLWFGGRHGASRVELRSDLEGRFAGVLPRAGWWRLELAAPEQDLEVETRVEIEPGRSGDAFLRLELPDTELFGRVVDEQGRGVAEAKVWLRDTQGFTQKRTNETGEFEFRAFEPGPAEVGASASTPAGRLTGAPVRMPVVESVPLGPVELRLRRTRTLTGRVVSAAGRPVAAALIDLSTFSPLTAAYSSSVRSGPDGTFEAEVHPDAEALQAVVSPPGYSLQSLTLPPTDPLVLNLTREHGTLILDRGPPVPPEQQPSPRRLVVLVDGTLLPHQRLLNWSRGHGEVWPEDSPTAKVPRLAPGHYRACLTTTDAMAAAALAEGSWRAALERCAEGFLSPGGSLTLQIPPADASPPAER